MLAPFAWNSNGDTRGSHAEGVRKLEDALARAGFDAPDAAVERGYVYFANADAAADVVRAAPFWPELIADESLHERYVRAVESPARGGAESGARRVRVGWTSRMSRMVVGASWRAAKKSGGKGDGDLDGDTGGGVLWPRDGAVERPRDQGVRQLSVRDIFVEPSSDQPDRLHSRYRRKWVRSQRPARSPGFRSRVNAARRRSRTRVSTSASRPPTALRASASRPTPAPNVHRRSSAARVRRSLFARVPKSRRRR